jgi:hypothetical protein
MSEIQDRTTRHDEHHEFLRQITIPEEDRAKYGMPRSQGGYRWFRSPNVVCLEKAATAAIKRRCVEPSA